MYEDNPVDLTGWSKIISEISYIYSEFYKRGTLCINFDEKIKHNTIEIILKMSPKQIILVVSTASLNEEWILEITVIIMVKEAIEEASIVLMKLIMDISDIMIAL